MNPGAASGKCIFYVEDDAVVLTAYRSRLQEAGFDVETSVDGIEAMRILSARDFDLIILDLMLPRFSGIEILKSIRANPRLKATPVVVVSSNREAVENSVMELGDKFLMKGEFKIESLVQAVEQLLAAGKSHGNAQAQEN